MRKFYLLLDGTRYALNGENHIRFVTPGGLGADMADVYAESNDGFFRRVDRRGKQSAVTGELVFTGGSAYSKYKTFADALLKADAVQLVYDPNGTEYKADVSVNFLTKTESVADVYMTVPTSFTLLSPWYTDEELTGTSVSVTAGGQIGTGVVVEMYGAVTNPQILLGDFALCALTYTLPSNEKLEFSTLWDDCHVTINGDDAIQYVDITNPLYEHSNGAFTITNSGNKTMYVLVRKYWRTV